MFVDLWFNFCCSKRQKQEPTSDIIRQPQQEISNSESVSQRQNQEKFAVFVDSHRNQQNNEKKSPTNHDHLKISIEHKISQPPSPTEEFLNLGQENQVRQGSFENIASKQPSQQFLENSNHKQNDKNQLAQTVNVYNGDKQPTMKKSASTQTFENADGVKKKIRKENNTERRNVKIWEPEEDNLLRKYYIEMNGNWREIAKKIVGRNMNQCSQRWRRINPMENKQKWTFDVDQKIIQLVNQMGKRWVDIAKQFPGRSGKQIRERYLNKLDPNLKFESWTKQEDEMILAIYKQQGPKWSVIAQELKGRSENMVKNRFYSYIRRVQLGQQNPYQVVFTPPLRKNDQMDLESPSSGEFQKIAPYSEGSYSSGSTGSQYTNWDEDDIWKDDEYNDFQDQFNQKAQIGNTKNYFNC